MSHSESNDDISSSVVWFKRLGTLISKLPNLTDEPKPTWTKEQRQKWMNACTDLIDVMIECREESE